MRSLRLTSWMIVLLESRELSTAYNKLLEVIDTLFFEPHAYPLGHGLCPEATFIKVN
jgi:hypothetical protein